MNTLIKILKSRTIWTLVLMFVIGGVDAISRFIPSETKEIILGFLGFLIAYFKLSPSQTY